MKRTHIAAFVGPQNVEIIPTIALIRTMIRRGHVVTCIVSSEFAMEFRRIGADVICHPKLHSGFEAASNQNTAPRENMNEASKTNYSEIMRFSLASVAPILEENKPDLILVSGVMAGPGLVLQSRLRVPAILCTSAVVANAEFLHHENLVSEAEAEECAEIRAINEEYGVRDDRWEELPMLLFYSSSFQAERHCLHARHLYAPRCSAERPYDHLEDGKKGDVQTTILISASTHFDRNVDYYKLIIRELAKRNFKIVLAVGANVDPNHFLSLPACCDVVQHVPLVSLMKCADVIICMGGMATTMEALYHGLPIIALSCGYPELEFYADNVRRHGIGIHLRDGEMTSARIGASVAAVLTDKTLLDKVREMQKMVKHGAGAEEAANWIEESLSC